jgi:hypothetical protein
MPRTLKLNVGLGEAGVIAGGRGGRTSKDIQGREGGRTEHSLWDGTLTLVLPRDVATIQFHARRPVRVVEKGFGLDLDLACERRSLPLGKIGRSVAERLELRAQMGVVFPLQWL